MTVSNSAIDSRGTSRGVLLLTLITLLPLLPARADFRSGMSAYEKRQFDVALKEFTALAEIGHARSQFNLASMHLRGEGTPKSTQLGYAWMTIAAANASPQAEAQIAKWGDIADPEEKAAAARLAAQFGPDAIAARLLPVPRCELPRPPSGRKAPRSIHIEPPDYPMKALSRGLIGWLQTMIYIDPDGRAREVWITEAIPRDEFEPAVIRALMQGRYEPATIGEEAVGGWGRFSFHFQPGSKDEVRKALDRYLRELSPEVEAGNPAAQYITGVLNSFQGVGGDDAAQSQHTNGLIERAARSGLPEAQFHYGLFVAASCEAGSDPGRYWIHQAAASGVSNAELWLGSALLSDSRATPERLEPALFWLERAATSKTPSALRALASALLRSPTPDYTRVLRIAEDIVDRHAYDPSAYLLRAQAYAARGRFPKAVEAQTQAIKRAKAIGWKLQPLERDLEEYRNGRAASAPDDTSEPRPGS